MLIERNITHEAKLVRLVSTIEAIRIRRCAGSDEVLVTMPDVRGDPVVLVARVRDLRSQRRLGIMALDQATQVLAPIDSHLWRAIVEARVHEE